MADYTECLNFVAGDWKKPSGEEIKIISPLNGKEIGQTWQSSNSDLDEIVKSAEKAAKDWAQTPLKERTQIMFRFREELLANMDEIAATITSENGKTIAESKAGIMKGIEVLEFAISLQNLDEGSRLEVSRGVYCEYRREPLGIVASITPFNFPAMVPMWTIPIAITLGNAYIWKPSEKTPLTSIHIANCLKRAGLPDGVLSIAQGGKDIVNAILEHKKIKAVSFVGSTPIAKLVYSKGSSEGKRVLALGGAKNHIFLLPDATPDISAEGICNSFTGCAGQRCMAASVLLAVGEVDHIVSKISEHAQSLKLGDQMGAVITKTQKEFLHQAIETAIKDGATLLLDGRNATPPSGMEDGNWIGPTILDNVPPNAEAATKELFGPVISIIRCKNLSEALEIENNNPYGNAASVFTNQGAAAELIMRKANAGMVGINIGVPVPREPFSFAGIADSKFGHGEITGEGSLNFWSNLKKITTKWQKQEDANWMS